MDYLQRQYISIVVGPEEHDDTTFGRSFWPSGEKFRRPKDAALYHRHHLANHPNW